MKIKNLLYFVIFLSLFSAGFFSQVKSASAQTNWSFKTFGLVNVATNKTSYGYGEIIQVAVKNWGNKSIYYLSGCPNPFLLTTLWGQIIPKKDNNICEGFFLAELNPGQSFSKNINPLDYQYQPGYFRLKFFYGLENSSEKATQYSAYSNIFQIR